MLYSGQHFLSYFKQYSLLKSERIILQDFWITKKKHYVDIVIFLSWQYSCRFNIINVIYVIYIHNIYKR